MVRGRARPDKTIGTVTTKCLVAWRRNVEQIAPGATRRLTPVVERALRAFRVVVVTGPRQAGKTTLVRHVLGGAGTLVRLDDEATLQAARRDRASFARLGELPRAFDEIRRGGDPLVRAIKAVVDDEARRGQFLLNGSADFLTVPSISESLAGRAAFVELWPFTQGEMNAGADRFVDVAFSDPERFRHGPASGSPSSTISSGSWPVATPKP